MGRKKSKEKETHYRRVPKKKEGLSMIDFDICFTAMKTSWVSKLITTDLPSWNIITTKYFNNFGKNFYVFNMNLDNMKSLNELGKIPDIYLQVILS